MVTIPELQSRMEFGALTARALAQSYLDRIVAIDKQGPAVNAVIELNPDALDIATALDTERATTGSRGPLHGIPVILKDNIDTADRMMTTAGSLALMDSIAPEDAFVAARLRDAGAVILGKSNLSEWANYRSDHSSNGWSSRGGQTRNPYALDRNPWGSSSGSAVAVAADLCSVAVGTETDGSIVCPAQANSVVGMKPTVGLVSRFGIIPISHSQDTAGPMARTVSDAAILLGAFAGADPRDPVTEESSDHTHGDYTSCLDEDGLRGARIGLARDFMGIHPAVDIIVQECIESIEHAGAQIVDPVAIGNARALRQTEMIVFSYEFKAGLTAYLQRLGPDTPMRSLAEIIAFNQAHADSVMPFFGQDRLLRSQERGPLSDAAYVEAQSRNQSLARDSIDGILDQHRLDAIVAPTGGPAGLTDWVNGDTHPLISSTPAAVAGYPNITVPAGYIHGLPVGISFFASAYQEPTLIRIAYAFEQATRVRRPPQFLPSATMEGQST